jgi:hypothetical protein
MIFLLGNLTYNDKFIYADKCYIITAKNYIFHTLLMWINGVKEMGSIYFFIIGLLQ